MKFVAFVGIVLLTGWLASVTPWWAQAWLTAFWLCFYVGALRGAWRAMMQDAQATASSKQLMKDADDSTPLDVGELGDAIASYMILAIAATALLTSLLWFTWS